MRSRPWFPTRHLREDAVAGVVLGVQSVPDGLATGLLAGVNPVAGLYAYLVGTFTGALVTSSSFMAVQGTGAMAMIVADVPAVHQAADPTRALFTLSVVTGAIMIGAGLLRLGSMLRFVSNAVMVGFINAVGVNIVLGQLSNLTGYAAQGPNRVVRALQTVIHPDRIDLRTLTVGLVTIALILVLERTRVGPLGLVVAVVVTSGATVLLGWGDVAVLDDLSSVSRALPSLVLPQFGLIPALLVPAASLAFVGLVQGAGVAAAFPDGHGRSADVSRDFVGQGAANVASGLLQGMPVGGSMSATSLNVSAGARSRRSLLVASVVMAATVLLLGPAVGAVAMPALAGLLMLIGFRTIRPADLASVWRTGPVQKAVVIVTFLLTMVVPLQYAVLAGVGLSVILHIVRQSNQVTIRQRVVGPAGHTIEVDPPAELPADAVLMLQPYGSLFFAAAPVFEGLLPRVTSEGARSVVIVRLRGRTDLGTTFIDVLRRYATSLTEAGSKLVLVSTTERIDDQLEATGLTPVIGRENIYTGDERVGSATQRAEADALAWVLAQGAPGSAPGSASGPGSASS